MDVATDFGGGYTPHDADGFERGPVRLREALQYSLNIPAVKAASITTVARVMQRAQDFGLQFPPNSNPGVSVGIGTVEVHPADLVSAYGAIADSGTLVQRRMILSVTDAGGNEGVPPAALTPKVTHPSTPQATYVMTSILAGNTDPAQNNWWSQYQLTEGKARRPATLKTGTSDQTEDLFAVGYVAPPASQDAPAIVAGVWAGNSDHAPGHSVMSLELAAPIWHAFMQDVTKGTPVVDFPQPSGVTWATVDANSGLAPGPVYDEDGQGGLHRRHGPAAGRQHEDRGGRGHGEQYALDVGLPGDQGHEGFAGPQPGGRQATPTSRSTTRSGSPGHGRAST